LSNSITVLQEIQHQGEIINIFLAKLSSTESTVNPGSRAHLARYSLEFLRMSMYVSMWYEGVPSRKNKERAVNLVM
jgi:hypothetical protein